MDNRLSLQGADRAKVGVTLISATVFVTVVLAARSSAMTVPVSIGWVFVTAMFVGGLNIAGLYAMLTSRTLPQSWEIRFALALFTSALTLFAILTITARGTVWHLGLALGLALLLVTAEVWTAVRSGRDQPGAEEIAHADDPSNTFEGRVNSDEETPIVLSPDTEQQWRRWIAGGRDHLEGCVRLRFLPGQATATVHVPLQPAMPSVPDVELEPVDDVDLRISADPVLPYGVRLVCRRTTQLETELNTAIAVAISAAQQAVRAA